MIDMQQWIDELKSKIVEEDDNILFNETTGCLLSGHKRAAYILAWISIVESLKRKIKLFSNLGDSRANESLAKVEKAEDDKLSTDRLIIEESQKCGILDGTDISTINFLWQQRCIFAHPYNKQPEEDEVRHIITQAIKLVLAKEVLYSKDFLTELADNIANKPFFLPTETDRIREYAKNIIARTPISLHPFLFKTLLYKVGEVSPFQEKIHELRKLRFFIVELFINTSILLEKTDWSLEHRVTNYPYECFVGFVHQEIWNKFPDRIKEMLIAYLEGENDNYKLNSLKSICNNLIQNGVLSGIFKEKYFAKLKGLKFDSVINFYGCNEAKFERIRAELESWQYEQQNPVIDYLRSEMGQKMIKLIDEDKQFYLGRLLRTCASGGHWKTQFLITDILNSSIDSPEMLLAGLAYSSFISRQEQYSLDKDFVIKAVILLNKISIEKQNEVYSKILSVLKQSQPGEFDKFLYSESTLIELSKSIKETVVDLSENNGTNFENLMEEIKKYFA